MADVKLTKTDLRIQQVKLAQLRKYLPTLQLKKAMLQAEVNQTQLEIEGLIKEMKEAEERVEKYCALFSERNTGDFFAAISIVEVKKSYENIAGVDIPVFEEVVFAPASYALFDTPVWFESAMVGVKNLMTVREKVKILEEKKRALEKELREVSIRVNLFEKIMIPRATQNIKKIKIFLGDQQLAAVSQAKVSKKKILLRSQQAQVRA